MSKLLQPWPQKFCPEHKRPLYVKTGMKAGVSYGRSFYICLADKQCRHFVQANDIETIDCTVHSKMVALRAIGKDSKGDTYIFYKCEDMKVGWCAKQLIESYSENRTFDSQVKGEDIQMLQEEKKDKKVLETKYSHTESKNYQTQPEKESVEPPTKQSVLPSVLKNSEDVFIVSEDASSDPSTSTEPCSDPGRQTSGGSSNGSETSSESVDLTSPSLSDLQQIETSVKKVQSLMKPSLMQQLPDKGQALIQREQQLLAKKHAMERILTHDDVIHEDKKSDERLPSRDMQQSNSTAVAGSNTTVVKPSITYQPVRGTVPHVHPAYAAFKEQEKRLYGGKMTDARMVKVKAITRGAIQDLYHSLDACPTHEEPDPAGLTVPLMKHQREALAWLLWREQQQPPSGILADDMGLGKTLTMISLIMKDMESSTGQRLQDIDLLATDATLVVCPASVVMQWEQEIKRRVQHGQLSVYIHHGAGRLKYPEQLIRYDVVITSYSVLNVEGQNAIAADVDNAIKAGETVPGKRKAHRKTSHCVLPKLHWHRVILDEGHTIKNHKTSTAVAACNLEADHRWILTGTPVQNDLLDMYSLIKFLRVTPFSELGVWKNHVSVQSRAGFQRLDILVKSLLLRRTKDAVKTTVAGSLPEKREQLHSLELSDVEAFVHWLLFRAARCFVATEMVRTEEAGSEVATEAYLADERFLQYDLENLPLQLKAVSRVVDYEILRRMSQQATADSKGQSSLLILTLILRLQQSCNHLSLLATSSRPVSDTTDSDSELAEQMASMQLSGESEEQSKQSHQSDWPECFGEKFLSTKICRLIEELRLIQTEMPFSKSVVVSQWTSMLNIIENHLTAAGIVCSTIRGSMTPTERQHVVEAFNGPRPTPEVLLLSLRAGGCGLNLIGGSHLFLVDPHWNPALEQQACDRIYRVGQTRDVVIHKFVCQKTIEEKLLIVQQKKKAIADRVLTGDRSYKGASKLTLEDLRTLFDV